MQLRQPRVVLLKLGVGRSEQFVYTFLCPDYYAIIISNGDIPIPNERTSDRD